MENGLGRRHYILLEEAYPMSSAYNGHYSTMPRLKKTTGDDVTSVGYKENSGIIALCGRWYSYRNKMKWDAYRFMRGYHTTIIKWPQKLTIATANPRMEFSPAINWMVAWIWIRQRWYWRYWYEIVCIVVFWFKGGTHTILLEPFLISVTLNMYMGRYEDLDYPNA